MENHREENRIHELLGKAKQVTLTKEKKDKMAEHLMSLLQEHPVQEQKTTKFLPTFTFFKNRSYAPYYMTIAALAFVIIAGGITSAQAESALPGQVLYAVKVGFNEKIMESFAFSPKAKITIDIGIAERRLQEAEKLISQGNTDGHEVQLNKSFKEHTQKVLENIANSANSTNENSETIASNFELSLRNHTQIIQELKKNKHKGDFEKLLQEVEDSASKISDARIELHKRIMNGNLEINASHSSSDENK